MPRRVLLSVALALAVAAAGCATAAPGAASNPDGTGTRPSAFEAWALGNATGAFFSPVGPAGGTGVRFAWPQ